SFVNDPYTRFARFDYSKFYEVVYESQRLMDDLVDLELEAIDRILSKIDSDREPDYIKDTEVRTWKLLKASGEKGRRTGLGITALADALAALGMAYDGDKAAEETEAIMKEKCRAEFDSSIDLAIERGPFSAFDPEIEKTSGFVSMLETELPEVHSRMMQHGRRNISISTVAPTGTLSLLAQTSSGIEPVFMLNYKRRRKINVHNPSARVDFVDAMGDKWEEFIVYHHGLKKWMDVTGNETIGDSPYAGCTAPEIDWRRRVALQPVVQQFTAHSVSSTVNLPEEVSEQSSGDISLNAWQSGLKGIAAFREASRSGVMVSASPKKHP